MKKNCINPMHLPKTLNRKTFLLLIQIFPVLSGIVKSQSLDFELDKDTVCVKENVSIVNNSFDVNSFDWTFLDDSVSFEYKHSHFDTFWDYTNNTSIQISYEIDDIVKQGEDHYFFTNYRINSDLVLPTSYETSYLFRCKFNQSLSEIVARDTVMQYPFGNVSGINIEKDIDSNYYGFFVLADKYKVEGDVFLIRASFGTDVTSVPVLDTMLQFNVSDFSWMNGDYLPWFKLNAISHQNNWYLFHYNTRWHNLEHDSAYAYIQLTDGLGGGSSDVHLKHMNTSKSGVLFNSKFSDFDFFRVNDVWYAFYLREDSIICVAEFEDDFSGIKRIVNSVRLNSGFVTAFHHNFFVFVNCEDVIAIFFNYKTFERSLNTIRFNGGLEGEMMYDANWDVDFFPVPLFTRVWHEGKYLNFFRDIRMELNFQSENLHTISGFFDSEPEFSFNLPGQYTVLAKNTEDIWESVCKDVVVMTPPDIQNIDMEWASNCDTSDGNISIFPPFQSDDFQFSIDGGNTYQDTNYFGGLSIGNYTPAMRFGSDECVIVSDTVVELSSVNSPLIESILKTNGNDCSISNGTIEIIVSGTHDAFEFKINEDEIWDTIGKYDALSGGDYYISIRNRDSTCQVNYAVPIVLDEPILPQIETPLVRNVSDCGLEDGLIQMNALGNFPTMLFSIDSLHWQLTSGFHSLSPGKYPLYAKYLGASHCTVIYYDSVLIAEPKAPKIDSILVSEQKSCFHPDGAIRLIASGGVDSIQYSFNNGNNWSFKPDTNKVVSGQYIVGVRNSNGTCEVMQTTPVFVLEACKDSVFDNFCNDGENYLLNDVLPKMQNDSGFWYNTKGDVLAGDSIIFDSLGSGVHQFFFEAGESIICLFLEIETPKRTGIEFNTNFCDNEVELFETLQPETYDIGGYWRDAEGTKVLNNSISGLVGTMSFCYGFPFDQETGCKNVETCVKLSVDSIPPVLNCSNIEEIVVVLAVGEEGHLIEQDNFPLLSENCSFYFLSNTYNGDSSMVGENLLEGEYEIIWSAVDLAGNQSQCVSKYIVKKSIIPNLITPNGDGFNDNWEVDIVIEYPNSEFYIYNNWGNLVYSCRNGYANWNGEVDGKLVPVGTYHYVIVNNKERLFDGSITVWY